MKTTKSLLVLVAAFFIAACETEPTENLEESIVEATPENVGAVVPTALFDPNNSVIPYPNNLLFGDTSVAGFDGTLNIPVTDENNLADPQVALNALDGFSTVAPITSGFTTAIDTDSINGTSVRLYQVELTSGVVTGVDEQLTFGVDYAASTDATGETLVILPLRPLAAKSSYMVVITDDLKTTSGSAFGPSISYELFKSISLPFCVDPPVAGCTPIPGALMGADLAQVEGLINLINISEATIAANDAEISTADIIQSWSFTTQSVNDVLIALRDDINNDAVTGYTLDSTVVPAATPDPEDDNGIIDTPQGAADVYVGTIDVPYFLDASANGNDPTALASYWQGVGGSNLTQFNTTPVLSSTESIPIMISIPKLGGPEFPVVIFQHGFTRDRTMMLAVADSLAAAGLAVVSIDLPLHGITDDTSPFYQAGQERTFDLDLVDNTTRVPVEGGDGAIDSSGTHFTNIANLLNLRDNIRQALSDLFTLTYAITSGDLTAGSATFDEERIYFLGHSGGAIAGVPFVNMEDNVRDAAFVAGGGYIMKLFDGSAAFSPLLINGLAANGISKGTADYEAFLGAAQTVIDSGDGINYSVDIAENTDRGLLGVAIVGGNTSPSDLTVPNTVPDSNDSSGTAPAPLAGTLPQFNLMGITPVNSDQAGSDLKHSVNFVVGNHGSLLSPAADDFNSAETNLAVTTEMQSIIATFLASDGNSIDVSDDTLLQPPPAP